MEDTQQTGGTGRKLVHIVTMGCAKNEVDSADMTEKLQARGFAMTDDPEQADAIIVNTCSFIQAATQESLDAIFDMAGLERVERGEAHVIVAGCMPARYGDDLTASLDEVKTFVPCSKEDDIADIVAGLFPDFDALVHTTRAEKPAATVNPSAYVKISDGCDRFCSYCTIPYIRGRYHSFTLQQIETDVLAAEAAGAREIVLIAQDTGRWGEDFEKPSSLADLMATLAACHPNLWFRVMYLQPEGVSDDLLDVMASHENICSYLDIPLQQVNERILRSMNRTGSRESYTELLAHIRDIVPDITLRTTLIAGFPGETDEEFEELCDFLQDAEFDYVGVFPYSQEEGTRAAELDEQVDEETKLERAQELRDIADDISQALIAQRVGRRMDVIVLGREEDDQLYGRAKCQAPDVDGVTYIGRGNVGDIITVEITDTLLYEMEGE